jgi:hypothetical protein
MLSCRRSGSVRAECVISLKAVKVVPCSGETLLEVLKVSALS